MKRGARSLLLIMLGAYGPQVASAQDMFIGGTLDDDRSSGRQSSLSAPWRGGRHSGPAPDYHTVQRGDTLWDITGFYYGNPWDWPRVWSINPEIANPHWIYPNDRVRLANGGAAEASNPASSSGLVAHRPTAATGNVRVRNAGFLDADALERQGRIVGSASDHMMLTEGDEIWVRYTEDDDAPARGTQLTVYRRIPESERDPEEHGSLVRLLGTAVVRSYDEDGDIVRAQITEALEPIERGFEVAEAPRRIENVAPVPNARDVDTTVAGTLYPRHIIGDNQLIFVEVGAEDGVEVGNRFFVVREADPWYDSLESGGVHTVPADGRHSRESGVDYPPEVIAEARVISTRPHSSTLLVTRTTDVINVGERLQMRRGF
jgi:hypothetical protein